jgi:hypothetical protein
LNKIKKSEKMNEIDTHRKPSASVSRKIIVETVKTLPHETEYPNAPDGDRRSASR